MSGPVPPLQVWTAFLLGAASISLLGVARAPFMSLLTVSDSPKLALTLRAIFGVAAPEEIVKILVIVAVSWRRRRFADPRETVVYGAAAGLGFAAYENLAYLVQHPEMWRALAGGGRAVWGAVPWAPRGLARAPFFVPAPRA